MFLINNKGHGIELIRGEAGKSVFCEECENYGKCDYNGQRVLQCNLDIIEFANEIEQGFNMYVWDGNLRQQPAWWFALLKHCQSIIAEIRTDNGKRLQNKNNRR